LPWSAARYIYPQLASQCLKEINMVFFKMIKDVKVCYENTILSGANINIRIYNMSSIFFIFLYMT
jgi:hypothetical protein